MIIFETERLVVRQYTENDSDRFFSLNGDEEVMRYIRAVKSRIESDVFLRQVIADYIKPHTGRWAVWEKNMENFVGSFAIIPIPAMPGHIQLGYSLTPSNWGQGYATELTRAGLNYFMVHHSHPEIFGVTEKDNIASQKVLLKAGFRAAGTLVEDQKELLLFKVDRSAPPSTE